MLKNMIAAPVTGQHIFKKNPGSCGFKYDPNIQIFMAHKHISSLILSLLSRFEFQRIVHKYNGDYRAKPLSAGTS